MFRFFTQFVNHVSVTLYPVYTPSAAEKVILGSNAFGNIFNSFYQQADPSLYAHNVQVHMAKLSGLKMSESGLEEKKEYLALIRKGDARLA